MELLARRLPGEKLKSTDPACKLRANFGELKRLASIGRLAGISRAALGIRT
jgi:hypothetical protein